MLGAIIGDIVGSRWEFNPTNDYNFELFSDRNSFTDDTVCTMAVADALLHGKKYGDSLHEWCRRYPDPKGSYGGSFAQWVISDNPKPYGSFGNGSAMRVSPVGWWFDNKDAILEEAQKSAECTHSHPEGIKGAQAVALAIFDCRNGKGLEEALDLYNLALDSTFSLEAYRNIFDETCQGTVPPALWILAHSTSFEDVIRKAVSLGADADTIGAIAGSIAEALWEIPEWMKEKAMGYLPEEMKTVVTDFYRHLNRRSILPASNVAIEKI